MTPRTLWTLAGVLALTVTALLGLGALTAKLVGDPGAFLGMVPVAGMVLIAGGVGLTLAATLGGKGNRL